MLNKIYVGVKNKSAICYQHEETCLMDLFLGKQGMFFFYSLCTQIRVEGFFKS